MKSVSVSKAAVLDICNSAIDLWSGQLGEGALIAVRNAVMDLPTVDAVPVVRCRDCEHKDRESGFCHGRGWPMQLVPDDGFCDKGKERREGAKDGTAEEAEKEV